MSSLKAQRWKATEFIAANPNEMGVSWYRLGIIKRTSSTNVIKDEQTDLNNSLAWKEIVWTLRDVLDVGWN